MQAIKTVEDKQQELKKNLSEIIFADNRPDSGEKCHEKMTKVELSTFIKKLRSEG